MKETIDSVTSWIRSTDGEVFASFLEVSTVLGDEKSSESLLDLYLFYGWYMKRMGEKFRYFREGCSIADFHRMLSDFGLRSAKWKDAKMFGMDLTDVPAAKAFTEQKIKGVRLILREEIPRLVNVWWSSSGFASTDDDDLSPIRKWMEFPDCVDRTWGNYRLVPKKLFNELWRLWQNQTIDFIEVRGDLYRRESIERINKIRPREDYLDASRTIEYRVTFNDASIDAKYLTHDEAEELKRALGIL